VLDRDADRRAGGGELRRVGDQILDRRGELRDAAGDERGAGGVNLDRHRPGVGGAGLGERLQIDRQLDPAVALDAGELE
jgi:hypothetical protein